MLQLDATIDTTNPWTGEVVGSFTAAGARTMVARCGRAAVRRPRACAPRAGRRAATCSPARPHSIRARHEELAELMVAEVGKPVTEAPRRGRRAPRAILDFYAQETRRARAC